jgi:Iron-containing redox enzyme
MAMPPGHPSPAPACVLPDEVAALPRRRFEFSAAATAEAAAIIAQPPTALFERLLRDQESEATWLVARRVLEAFLSEHAATPAQSAAGGLAEGASADDIAAQVAEVRAGLAATVGSLLRAGPDARDAVHRQRAPLGMLGGCWLDVVSQPATQPSVIVNRLYAQHFTLCGAGNPRRSAASRRRRRLEEAGIYLPDIAAADFLAQTGARPLTVLHGCFYLALSRLPANFLPELAGVHYAWHALGVDDLLAGQAPPLPEPDLRAILAAHLEFAGPAERRRLLAGVRLAVALEREHVALLAELAAWHDGQTLESKVAAIVARHAPFAGRQHQQVRIGGRLLSDTFAEPGLDIGTFLREFREAPQLRGGGDGRSSFVTAVKFGGPMFGIFSDREAAVLQEWAADVQAGARPEIVLTPSTAGDDHARDWAAAITAAAPADVVIAGPGTPDDRELFYRLVNIENYASTLPVAAQRAGRLFAEAEILFTRGAAGRYTDATYFEYSPQALYERAERVYWEKLVRPYQPLTVLPDRAEVIFIQATYALGALIDATWLHRLANLGRRERPSDGALLSIYADEMGHGDLRKNHITLIHQALASMGIRLPHIRDAAFMDQGDLPDDLYGFSLHQLCMALFPDTFYNEILGYNLAIEMFGLGELRLHEIQKLRHYGFDDCYEQAHLTIDNLSAGHSRQAADIIVSYLDEVRRTLGEAAVPQEWRRVWRGYASLAYFVEPALVRQLTAEQEARTGPEAISLII